MRVPATISVLQALGAGCFGAVIGWFTYYVNRYRSGGVKLKDISTLIGIVGAGAVLSLFPEKTDLFGAYGIGLFVGFFGYFATLLLLVRRSPGFTVDWLLDGRAPAPGPGVQAPAPGTRPPMAPDPDGPAPVND